MSDDPIIRITEEDISSESDSITIKPTDLIGGENSNSKDPQPIPWNPQKPASSQKQATDIVLLIDTSGSMDADDYKPNRLEAAKQAAKMFTMRKVVQNYNDRVAVIGFGGTPTIFHSLDPDLERVLFSIEKLTITHTGTLIGTAIIAAANELMHHKNNRQAIVLLSDGADEFDNSEPVKVAQSLKGIKIFTIGIGTIKGGKAKLPHGEQKVYLNEIRLKEIAKVTRGDYLYAPDVPQLQKVYLQLADY